MKISEGAGERVTEGSEHSLHWCTYLPGLHPLAMSPASSLEHSRLSLYPLSHTQTCFLPPTVQEESLGTLVSVQVLADLGQLLPKSQEN